MISKVVNSGFKDLVTSEYYYVAKVSLVGLIYSKS